MNNNNNNKTKMNNKTKSPKTLITLILIFTLLITTFTYATSVLFKDIPENHPYNKVIYTLASKGIMSGDNNGNFYPDEYITRGELTYTLSKLLDYQETNIDCLCLFFIM